MKNERITKHTVEDRLRKADNGLKKLFNVVDTMILNLDNVHHYATGAYIGYKRIDSDSPFVEMHVRTKKNLLELHLRPIDQFFPNIKLYKVPDSHLWKLNTIKNVCIEDDLELVMALSKKSYEEVYITNIKN